MAGGNGFSSDDDVIGGINITPLVDVVLVLLIIFLITAPAIYQSAIKVQLPKAVTGEDSAKSPLSFTLSSTGGLSWGNDSITWEQLNARLSTFRDEMKKSGKEPADETAVIGADEKTPYGSVVKLMDSLRAAGFLRFAYNVDSTTPAEKGP